MNHSRPLYPPPWWPPPVPKAFKEHLNFLVWAWKQGYKPMQCTTNPQGKVQGFFYQSILKHAHRLYSTLKPAESNRSSKEALESQKGLPRAFESIREQLSEAPKSVCLKRKEDPDGDLHES